MKRCCTCVGLAIGLGQYASSITVRNPKNKVGERRETLKFQVFSTDNRRRTVSKVTFTKRHTCGRVSVHSCMHGDSHVSRIECDGTFEGLLLSSENAETERTGLKMNNDSFKTQKYVRVNFPVLTKFIKNRYYTVNPDYKKFNSFILFFFQIIFN